MQPEDGKWHFQAPRTPTKGAMLRDVPRHHSLSEVFLLLLTPAVLVACREELSSDTTGLSLAHVYKAMAVDILIRAERDMQPHLRLRGHRRSTPHRQKHPLEQVFKHLKERHKLEGLGFKKWQRVRNGVYITLDVARTKLSQSFRSHVAPGEFVTMDEKLKKWRGQSPSITKVPPKPEPIGHWTTQVCARLNSTGAPYCIGLYPYAGPLVNGTPVRTKTLIWTWALDLIAAQPHPVICTDSHYLDNSVRTMLAAKEVPFHCSIKQGWFRYVADPLKRKVTAIDEWAAMQHAKTGQIAVYHWSREKDVGKKLLLTSCLKKVPGVQESDNPPGWDEYKFMFNTCDAMNADIGKWWWPYRFVHWSEHFGEMFMLSTVLNALAIWLELQGPQEEEPSTHDLLLRLGTELFARAASGNLPDSTW